MPRSELPVCYVSVIGSKNLCSCAAKLIVEAGMFMHLRSDTRTHKLTFQLWIELWTGCNSSLRFYMLSLSILLPTVFIGNHKWSMNFMVTVYFYFLIFYVLKNSAKYSRDRWCWDLLSCKFSIQNSLYYGLHKKDLTNFQVLKICTVHLIQRILNWDFVRW